ncbi:MAG: tRNA1(Val) (adenine(37)-N6)-methyltransferase [Parvibaculaceae bacterium]
MSEILVPAGDADDAPVATRSDDGFLGSRLQILQPLKGYRAGIDAVLLAASISARKGERVLEAGSGVGVASLCLAARVAALDVVGLELQDELVHLARENARRNALQGRVSFMEGDIGSQVRDLVAMGLEPQSFDHVFANPPYYDPATASASPDSSKAQSHLTLGSDLDDWVRFLCTMVKPKGTVSFVHRADAMSALLVALQGRVGGIEIFPLWPAAGKPASRIILRGIKGSNAPLTLRSGLVLHALNGHFSEGAEAVLRHAAALRFDQPA